MITLQTKLDGFPEDVQSIEKPETSSIPFPSPGNISTGQAVGIFKYQLADETVPIWAKVLAIEKIAAFETLNSITKDELKQALKWLYDHFELHYWE